LASRVAQVRHGSGESVETTLPSASHRSMARLAANDSHGKNRTKEPAFAVGAEHIG